MSFHEILIAVMAGFALLMALMLFITFHDVMKLL